MSLTRHARDFGRHLRLILGAPGLMIGACSILSFAFGLYLVAREYDRTSQTRRDTVRGILADWVRLPDYLGYTLVDYADLWRSATPAQRPPRRETLRQGLDKLGAELDLQWERFPLIRVTRMEVVSAPDGSLARWQAEGEPRSGGSEVRDEIPLLSATRDAPVTLRVGYRLPEAVEAKVLGLEVSYRRLLLGLLGLSGFSLLCLGYMLLHAQALSERAAREAAQEATLDLADRTCHELGNGVFVLANERRNLARHLDLVERFLTEEPLARAAAARRAGLDPELAARWGQALDREYARRGIEPGLELNGSAALARHVLHQIDVCTEYLGMTVRELDGFLKRSELPITFEPVAVRDGFAEALALLRNRLDASGVTIAEDDTAGAEPVTVRADRRLLTHALVNLIKNAAEALGSNAPAGAPTLRLTARVEGDTVAIVIADNGPGIPRETLPRVFEVGYSTKGSGRGRGLAIVRDSVQLLEGEITARAPEGGGTEFTIRLPRASSPPKTGHPAPGLSATPGH